MLVRLIYKGNKVFNNEAKFELNYDFDGDTRRLIQLKNGDLQKMVTSTLFRLFSFFV